MKMQQWCVAMALAGGVMWAWALPSVAQVEAAVKQGDYAQAQVMMRDVVEAKPGSAKAQYLYAEILAHNGRFTDASAHAAQARQLDPALSFTAPDKFKGFEQMLAREQQHERAATTGTVKPTSAAWQPMSAPAARTGVPAWVWGAGLALLAWIAWRMLQRGNPGGGMVPASYGAQPAYGGAPAYGPMGGGAASSGSGLMGMGLAAAGGVAAGMLADRLLQQGHHQEALGSGVLEPGYFSGSDQRVDPDAQALENRPIDFGSGDDWGGGGGSVDPGGSDDGGW